MGLWSLGLGAVGAALAGVFLANSNLCLPKEAKAPLEYLEDADLRSTTDGGWALPLQSASAVLRNQSFVVVSIVACVWEVHVTDRAGLVQHSSRSRFEKPARIADYVILNVNRGCSVAMWEVFQHVECL